MSDQTRRTWAIIMLITFLAGLGLGVYSLIKGQNALQLASVLFLLFGGIGSFVLRRDLDEKYRQEAPPPEEEDPAGEDPVREDSPEEP